VSKEQIDFVNAKLKRLGLSRRADFFVADINEFVLNQPRFDFIFCTEVLEHLPNPIIALTKLRNQGHDETIFIYSVPLIYGSGKAQWFYRQFLTGDKWIETENIAKLNPQNEHYEFYHKQYSRNEIIQLLQEQGFQVLRIRFSNMTFNNKLVMEAYSLLCVLSFYRLDKLVNFITRNRFASQITLECKKSRYEKTIETK
jgi:2-polyprenyl-3-methyl-5-hydroxy-6-metoxy-1,4-benzoquinol methylase